MKYVDVQVEVKETIIYKREVTMSEIDYNAWVKALRSSPQGTAVQIRDHCIDIEHDIYDTYAPEVTVFDIVK